MYASQIKYRWSIETLSMSKCTSIKLFGYESSLSWRFEQVKLPFVPAIIQCQIEAFGCTSLGMSTGFKHTTTSAYSTAFAEAFERLIIDLNVKFDNRQFTTSNGFAAGSTVKNAMNSARSELIERHLVLKAWQEKKGWTPHSAGFSNNLKLWIMKAHDWRFNWFRIYGDNQEQVVVACLARHPVFGAAFDAAHLSADQSYGDIESKIAESVMLLCADAMNINETSFYLPTEGGPEAHKLFYRNPKNLAAFEFLDRPDSSDSITYNNLYLEECLIEVLYDNNQFPAVARVENQYLENLEWGKASIRGANIWPHPIV